MKKLFISQPMNGRSAAEILMERRVAVKEVEVLTGEEVEVLDTFYNDFPPGAKPLEYLARSIHDLAKADIVYFCKGWESARGCVIERMCAVEYGIEWIGVNE